MQPHKRGLSVQDLQLQDVIVAPASLRIEKHGRTINGLLLPRTSAQLNGAHVLVLRVSSAREYLESR